MVPETAYTITTDGSIRDHGNCARMFVQDLDWRTLTDTFEDALVSIKENYGHYY